MSSTGVAPVSSPSWNAPLRRSSRGHWSFSLLISLHVALLSCCAQTKNGVLLGFAEGAPAPSSPPSARPSSPPHAGGNTSPASASSGSSSVVLFAAAVAATGGRLDVSRRTVFAPSDDAWRAMLQEIGARQDVLLALPQSRLAEALALHVTADASKLTASDLRKGLAGIGTSAPGKPQLVVKTGQDGKILIHESGSEGGGGGSAAAQVVSTDLPASALAGTPLAGAAAVHAISRVLIAPPFSGWTRLGPFSTSNSEVSIPRGAQAVPATAAGGGGGSGGGNGGGGGGGADEPRIEPVRVPVKNSNSSTPEKTFTGGIFGSARRRILGTAAAAATGVRDAAAFVVTALPAAVLGPLTSSGSNTGNFPAALISPNGVGGGGRAPAAVFLHGMGCPPELYAKTLAFVASHGYHVVSPRSGFDISCPGSCTGGSIMQFAQDALDAVAWVRSADADPKHPLAGKVDSSRGVALLGHSLGGGVAFLAASRAPKGALSALAALAPWNVNPCGACCGGSRKDEGAKLNVSSGEDCSAAVAAGSIGGGLPKVIMAGDEDAATPFSANSEAIFGRASSPTALFGLRGGTHCFAEVDTSNAATKLIFLDVISDCSRNGGGRLPQEAQYALARRLFVTVLKAHAGGGQVTAAEESAAAKALLSSPSGSGPAFFLQASTRRIASK